MGGKGGGVARGGSLSVMVLYLASSTQPVGITQASTKPSVRVFQDMVVTSVAVAGSGAAVMVVSTARKGTAAAVAASRANVAVLMFIINSLERFADDVVSNREADEGYDSRVLVTMKVVCAQNGEGQGEVLDGRLGREFIHINTRDE